MRIVTIGGTMGIFNTKTIEIYMNAAQSWAESGITLEQLSDVLSELGFTESSFRRFNFNHEKIEKIWSSDDYFYICLYDSIKDIGEKGDAIWRLDARVDTYKFSMSYSGWPEDTIEWIKYFMANPEIIRGLKKGQVPTVLSA
jgi:hypothetical protein